MKICHASISENKSIQGNRGDQTAKEVCIREWYSKPWVWMLRFPDSHIADKIATNAEKLANSNVVGYSQPDRNFLYQMLAKYNFDVDQYVNTRILSNTDCSAFVTACAVCAGIDRLRYSGNAPTTSTMVNKFAGAGFLTYSDPKYLTNTKYLRRGDILLKPASHVVIVLDDGAEAFYDKSKFYKKYTGSSNSFVDALKAVGETDTSFANRSRIAVKNSMYEYTGRPQENNELLRKLKNGVLIR